MDANSLSAGKSADPNSNEERASRGTARKILVGGAKLATGLVLAIITLVVPSAVVYGIFSLRNSGLSERKDWASIEAPTLDRATFNIATMWRDDKLNFILSVEPYTAPIREAREKSSQNTRNAASFILKFQDAGDFTVRSAEVNLKSMGQTIGETGEIVRLHYEGFSPLSSGGYRRITKWNIAWSLP
jgi:hypothetical protein